MTALPPPPDELRVWMDEDDSLLEKGEHTINKLVKVTEMFNAWTDDLAKCIPVDTVDRSIMERTSALMWRFEFIGRVVNEPDPIHAMLAILSFVNEQRVADVRVQEITPEQAAQLEERTKKGYL